MLTVLLAPPLGPARPTPADLNAASTNVADYEPRLQRATFRTRDSDQRQNAHLLRPVHRRPPVPVTMGQRTRNRSTVPLRVRPRQCACTYVRFIGSACPA